MSERSLIRAIERVPLDSLVLYPGNPRRGDVAAVAESLRENSQYEPLVVQASTRYVLAGNHRLLAAQELGWPEIDVVVVDVDDEHARRILLSSNRTADLGTYDEELLAAQLAALRDSYAGTGYSEADRAELEARLAALRGDAAGGGQDDAPEPPAAPASRLGETYELGPHRLVCGDARDPDAVAAAVGPTPAGLLLTDPPYGVEYVGKTKDALTIQNDAATGLRAMLVAAFGSAGRSLAAGAPFYLAAPAGPRGTDFRLALADAGWQFHQALVWEKDTMVLGHSDYHYQHEDVLYGWTPGPGRSGRGKHAGSRWYGGHAQTSVFQVPRPTRSALHPTMKPVDLFARFVLNSSLVGAVILDPFAGSGTTLIACDQNERRAALVELDPAYCDVIRQRYADHVGDPAYAPR